MAAAVHCSFNTFRVGAIASKSRSILLVLCARYDSAGHLQYVGRTQHVELLITCWQHTETYSMCTHMAFSQASAALVDTVTFQSTTELSVRLCDVVICARLQQNTLLAEHPSLTTAITLRHSRCSDPVAFPDGKILATWSTPMRSASEVCSSKDQHSLQEHWSSDAYIHISNTSLQPTL